jgi:hypothetical protein
MTTPRFNIPISGFAKYFPLIVMQIYLCITVIVFYYGPWPTAISNPLALFLYLALNHFALLAGYLLATWTHKVKPQMAAAHNNGWIWMILIFATIWILPKYWNRLSVITFDPGELIGLIAEGIRDPLKAYRRFHDTGFGGAADNIVSYLNAMVAPLSYAAIPVGFFFWTRLKLIQKLLTVVIVIAELGTWLARGTNKGLFDFAFLSVWMILAGHPALFEKGRNFKRFLFISFGLMLFITAINHFSNRHFNPRHVGCGRAITAYDPVLRIKVDHDRPILEYTPSQYHPLIIAFCGYLTGGYNALGMALEEPFVPCYGMGNSYFLTRITRHFFEPNYISNRSYPGRLEKLYRIDRYVRWHSFYTWWASDVTFFGVVIVVFWIGWCLSITWLDCLSYRNITSVILFSLFLTVVYYLPANNQVFAFSETFMSLTFYGFVRLIRKPWGKTALVSPSSRNPQMPHTVL